MLPAFRQVRHYSLSFKALLLLILTFVTLRILCHQSYSLYDLKQACWAGPLSLQKSGNSLPFSFYVQPFSYYTIYQIQLTSFPLSCLLIRLLIMSDLLLTRGGNRPHANLS